MRPLLLLLMLSGCATANWEVSPKAKIRSQATGRLKGCLGWGMGRPASPWQREACLAQNEAWCASQGLEKACGADGMW